MVWNLCADKPKGRNYVQWINPSLTDLQFFRIILYVYVPEAVAIQAWGTPFPFSSVFFLCPVSEWDFLFKASVTTLETARASQGLSKANSALDLLNTWQILLILLANRQWFLHKQDFVKHTENSEYLSHFGGSSIGWLPPTQYQPVLAVVAKSKGGGDNHMRLEHQEYHKSTGLDAPTMPTPPQTTEGQQCSALGKKPSLVWGCAWHLTVGSHTGGSLRALVSLRTCLWVGWDRHNHWERCLTQELRTPKGAVLLCSLPLPQPEPWALSLPS